MVYCYIQNSGQTCPNLLHSSSIAFTHLSGLYQIFAPYKGSFPFSMPFSEPNDSRHPAPTRPVAGGGWGGMVAIEMPSIQIIVRDVDYPLKSVYRCIHCQQTSTGSNMTTSNCEDCFCHCSCCLLPHCCRRRVRVRPFCVLVIYFLIFLLLFSCSVI